MWPRSAITTSTRFPKPSRKETGSAIDSSARMAEAVIKATGLRMSYGELEAVRGIDLQVQRGEIFAFLGPNGAGKTTTVEIFEGYRRRTGGDVQVLGVDPQHASRAWRQRVGFVLQECRLTPELTVREAVEQYAGYYEAPRDVQQTIGLVGLDEKADARTSTLSGGQQRRLDVALALIGDPELLFLDEPTTGFDPSARRQAWDVIGSMRDLGKTVFLTTHYMDEAQILADRAAIIVAGEIVAEGDPAQLGTDGGPEAVISFRLPKGTSASELPSPFAEAAKRGEALVSHASDDPLADLRTLIDWAQARGTALPSLEVRRPSLEDAYLELTSR
jgi:ABC-2 type transport system ATP-binding protein